MLLICPFYDSCNKKTEEAVVESPAIESPAIEQSIETIEKSKIEVVDNSNSENVAPKKSILERIEDFIDDGDSKNAFEIGAMSWVIFTCNFECQINDLKSSIEKNDYDEIFFGTKNICFVLIVIFSLLNFIFGFTKKIKLVSRFSKWILILLLIALICIVNEKDFKEISQIKWGYYSFIFVNILIFYNCKRFLKLQKP